MAARFLASPWTRSSAACRALVPAESVCLIPAAASDWLSAALHRPPCCTGLQLLVARLETTRDPQRPARYSWHLGTRPPGLWAEISACCLTWAMPCLEYAPITKRANVACVVSVRLHACHRPGARRRCRIRAMSTDMHFWLACE